MNCKYELLCLYCGHQWIETFFSKPDYLRCIICSDKNIELKKFEKKNVYGYED